MKKIGFIDYFIDEWHANNYPKWFREASLAGRFEISLAWEEAPKKGRKPLVEWCKEFDITPATSIKQVVEECDAICVLAPSNPEVHERLSDFALKSGKPVYIDKPLAPDKATAELLYAKAEANNTPLMSSSALRFGSDLQKAINETFCGQKVTFAAARGCGRSFWEYSIHQVEMIVALLGTGATRIMQCGNTTAFHMLIDYPDERRGVMTLMPEQGFQISVNGENDSIVIDTMDDFFPGLIEEILTFYDTGISPIRKEETIEIAAIVAAGIKALEEPYIWLDIN